MTAAAFVPPPGIEEPIELPERDERERAEQRFRIYELQPCGGCDSCRDLPAGVPRHLVPVCVAAVETAQAIGPALIALADDDYDAGITSSPSRGVKDDVEGRWICSLWSRRSIAGGVGRTPTERSTDG